MTFEKAMARLDEITALLSDGSTGLEKSLALYAEGAGLIENCTRQLNDAKAKIETLFPEKEVPVDAI